MNFEILESLGKIAGIAGIAIGALVLIFSGVIRKNIFPSLTKEQGYSVIRMLIVFASLLAFVGIGAWIYTEVQQNKKAQDEGLVVKYITGRVTDMAGNAVVSAEIEVAQFPNVFDRTDQNGKFAVKINGRGAKYLDIVLKHKSYKVFRHKVKVNFDEEGDEVSVEELKMETAYPPDQETTPSNESNDSRPITLTDPKELFGEKTNYTTITIKYMGDNNNCSLYLGMSIGGMEFSPTSNSYRVSNIPSGNQPYSISGSISCGYESCNAYGSGELYIEPGANYYVVWAGEGYGCEVGLFDESTYLQATSN